MDAVVRSYIDKQDINVRTLIDYIEKEANVV